VAFPDSDLSRYSVVVAPMLYMVKPGFAEKVEAFVAGGGTFVATHMTGRVDETDLAFENGYPGPLAKVLGVWIEETDALLPDQQNTIEMRDGSGVYTCGHLADITHAEGAAVIATYGSDFYAGTPAVTANRFGSGKAYFIASDPEEPFLRDLYGGILKSHGIAAVLDAPEGVEVSARQKDGKDIIFVLNHNANGATVELGERRFTNLLNGQTVSGDLALKGYDVAILV
jgi:beta-galactosidase